MHMSCDCSTIMTTTADQMLLIISGKSGLAVNISSTAVSQLHNAAQCKHSCLSGNGRERPCDRIYS